MHKTEVVEVMVSAQNGGGKGGKCTRCLEDEEDKKGRGKRKKAGDWESCDH